MQAVAVTAPIFIIIAIGYFFKRKGLFSGSTMRETNRFLFWVAMPALIIRNISSSDMSFFDDPWLPVVMNLSPFIMLLIGWAVGRYFAEEPRRFSVTVMGAVRSNQVFVGFPIAALAFGQYGLEAAAFFLAMTLIFFQLFSIGGAQLALEGEISPRAIFAAFKILFKNPLFLASIVSVAMMLTGFNKLPGWLDAVLKILADVGTGMALLMVGTEMVFENLFSRLNHVQKIVILRLIIHPILTYTLLSLYGAPVMLIKVATLLSGTPVAVNSLIVAKGMGMDSAYMADAVITTTALSMISVTFMLFLMGV